MIKYLPILLILISSNLKAQSWTLDDIAIYKTFDEFEPVLHQKNDTTYIINFWATWCGPCVKELPYFEELQAQYADEKVKVVLVSLDFKKKLQSKLVPFLNDRKIASEVIVLLDGKASKWIDRVDPSWSGAIPVTLVRKGEKMVFHETVFHSTAELQEIVTPFMD